MDKLRILQLSDIHNISCPKAMDPFKNMRHELIKDIKGYCEANQCSFDAILICGDIAFSGAEDEYDKSREFISKLCDTVGCKSYQVYVVPGNHDKERKEGKPALRSLLNWGMVHVDDEEKMFASLINEEPNLFTNLYLPFKNYMEFSRNFENSEPIMEKCIEDSNIPNLKIDLDRDKMFWQTELDNDFHGYNVNIIGLNSALSCDDNDWSEDWKPTGHKMYLSVFAHNNLELSSDKQINILMMHHPLKFIVNGEKLSEKFDKQFLLQFYGHVHLPGSLQSRDRGAVRVFSGAMQPPKCYNEEDKKKYIPIYNIVELDYYEDNGSFLEVNLIVNKWNGSTFGCYDEQSKQYTIELPCAPNRWKEQRNKKKVILPDGVSEREIKISFHDQLNHKGIIEQMYKGLYDTSKNDYHNCRIFLAKVDEDKRWVDLWNLLKTK